MMPARCLISRRLFAIQVAHRPCESLSSPCNNLTAGYHASVPTSACVIYHATASVVCQKLALFTPRETRTYISSPNGLKNQRFSFLTPLSAETAKDYFTWKHCRKSVCDFCFFTVFKLHRTDNVRLSLIPVHKLTFSLKAQLFRHPGSWDTTEAFPKLCSEIIRLNANESD